MIFLLISTCFWTIPLLSIFGENVILLPPQQLNYGGRYLHGTQFRNLTHFIRYQQHNFNKTPIEPCAPNINESGMWTHHWDGYRSSCSVGVCVRRHEVSHVERGGVRFHFTWNKQNGSTWNSCRWLNTEATNAAIAERRFRRKEFQLPDGPNWSIERYARMCFGWFQENCDR